MKSSKMSSIPEHLIFVTDKDLVDFVNIYCIVYWFYDVIGNYTGQFTETCAEMHKIF